MPSSPRAASTGPFPASSPPRVLEQTAASRIGKVMLAQFNNVAVFDKKPGRAWHYVGAFSPGACPTNLPSSVSAAWGLCSVGS